VKPGIKTTEFWIATLTTISTVGGALAGALPPSTAGIVAAIASGAYSIARGLAKSTAR
jgi:TRAP-type C4-dicarboxylate transport system permease large subunit